MSWKKVNKKEWIERGLPESTTFISPFYEWDRKKKAIKRRTCGSPVRIHSVSRYLSVKRPKALPVGSQPYRSFSYAFYPSFAFPRAYVSA